MRQSHSRRRLLASSVIASIAFAGALGTGAALAQEEDEEERAAQPQDQIVVVGSRLRRDVFNSPAPIQVITNEEVTLAGFASTSEVLQGTAVSGGTAQINNAFGGYVVDGGPGANTLSLRGLGATRTLVLLNGRRVAPAGSRGSVGSADLNVLPSSLIERIEILRDGASSVYGSDAVAGVVNIVTRSDLDGVVLSAQHNHPMDAGGAGYQSRLSIAAGTSGERWRVGGSFEYYNREELTYRDRQNAGFLSCPIDGWTDGSQYIDPLTGQPKCWGIDSGGVTINTIGTAATAGVPAPGNPTLAAYNRWRPNSAVTTGLVGFEGVSGGDLNVRDTFADYMLDNTILSPVEIHTAYFEGSYDLRALGNAEVYGEFLFNRRDSSQTGSRQLSLDYFVGSPLIPANIAALGPFALNQGLSPTSGPNANALVQARAFIGFGNYESWQTVDFAKGVAGIRGDFILPGWNYDVHVSTTRSESTYTSEQFLTDRLRNSLDVVAAPANTPASLTRGGFTCRVNVTAPGENCVPAPFLNTQTIGGDLPQDWVNYFVQNVTGTTVYTETVISGGIDGTLFTLPAGDVQAFFGAEWREGEIDDTPGIDSQTGNTYGFSTAAITRGSDSVWEVFGEVEVPLLANAPLAEALTFSASARYTDYDSYGSDSTYKVGLLWSPTNWMSVRGTYGTSYRAPALFEQYLGATSGFIASGNDPCNEWDNNSNPNIVTNCGSEGLNPGYTATSSLQVNSIGGLASGLEAETSTNLTVGLVLQPTLPASIGGDLSFSVDYYEIEVSNGVARAGASFILSECYNSSPADFAANIGYCALINRNPNTNQLVINNSYVNIADDLLRGLDYNLRYRRDVGRGSMVFNFYLTQYLERVRTVLPTDPQRNTVGIINQPEFAGTADVSYAFDNWLVRYGVDWTAATDYDSYYLEYFGYTLSSLGYQLQTGDYFVHNASLQYRADDWSITAGVRNLWNEEPPQISTGVNRVGNAPLYSGYDLVGRTAFINLTRAF